MLGKEGAGSIRASASSIHVGKMNQEQVDAMCPEDRGGKRGGFEGVHSIEDRDMECGGRKRWMDKMPFSPRILSWRDVQDDSCER